MSFTVMVQQMFKSTKKGMNDQSPMDFQNTRGKYQLFVKKLIIIKETKWKFFIHQSRDIYQWSMELLQVSSQTDPNWELGEQADRWHLEFPSIFTKPKLLKSQFFDQNHWFLSFQIGGFCPFMQSHTSLFNKACPSFGELSKLCNS